MSIRLFAVLAIVLWAVTLALPVCAYSFDYAGGPVDPKLMGTEFGFEYLLFGALGPMVLDLAAYDLPGYDAVPHLAIAGLPLAAFGWYAHPFWVWNIARMLLRRRPKALPAIISALLAALALGPYHIGIFDDQNVHSMSVPASGAFLWTAVMAIPLGFFFAEKLGQALKRKA